MPRNQRAYQPVAANPEFYISSGGYPQEIQGAQVGSRPTPRSGGNPDSIRRIQELNGSGSPVAPSGYPPDVHAFRPAQYNQNWQGRRTSDTWQNFSYPNAYRTPLDNSHSQSVRGQRVWPGKVAPRPVAIQQYALNTKPITRGTYSAVVPNGQL